MTMLFSKCSSFLDSNVGGYNFMGNIFAQFPMCHKLFLFPFVLLCCCFFCFFCSSNVPEEITSRCFLFFIFCLFDCLFRAEDFQARSSTQQALMFRM